MEKLNEIKYKTATVELSLKIDYEGETVWLTQEQMMQVLESSKSNISEHIKKVLSENLLVQSSTVRKFRTVASNGKTYNIKHYSLELVTLVGSRIDIKKTTEFKEYVINIINEYKKANKQYGGLNVLYTTKAHDRYIIIDQTKIYHVGHSIKDKTNKFVW